MRSAGQLEQFTAKNKKESARPKAAAGGKATRLRARNANVRTAPSNKSKGKQPRSRRAAVRTRDVEVEDLTEHLSTLDDDNKLRVKKLKKLQDMVTKMKQQNKTSEQIMERIKPVVLDCLCVQLGDARADVFTAAGNATVAIAQAVGDVLFEECALPTFDELIKHAGTPKTAVIRDKATMFMTSIMESCPGAFKCLEKVATEAADKSRSALCRTECLKVLGSVLELYEDCEVNLSKLDQKCVTKALLRGITDSKSGENRKMSRDIVGLTAVFQVDGPGKLVRLASDLIKTLQKIDLDAAEKLLAAHDHLHEVAEYKAEA